MKTRRLTPLLVLTMLTGGVLAQQPPSAEVLLKAAMQREQVDGDLVGAIDQYKTIVAKYADNRPVAAKALLQMGQCYEKLGKPEARDAYGRIVREYADSGAVFTTARTRLAQLQTATSAPFKPRNLDAMFKDDYRLITPSPDGKSVVYVRPDAERGEGLCVRDLAGASKERVLPGLTKDDVVSGLRWSPDSARVSIYGRFEQAFQLRVVNVARGESRTIAASKGDTTMLSVTALAAATWSGDGQRLAYGVRTAPDGPLEIRVTGAESGEAQTLDTIPVSLIPGNSMPGLGTLRFEFSLVWAPDSRRLAWVMTNGDTHALEVHTLNVITRESRTLVIPQPAKGGATWLTAWTPKDELFFMQTVPALGNDYFLMAASGGGEARKICEGRGVSGGDGCTGQLSPDGTLLITRKNVAEGSRTMLRDTVTGAERPLTLAPVIEDPAGIGFSPDGRLIGFRSRRDAKWGLYVVPVDRIPVATPIRIAELESDATAVTAPWVGNGLWVRTSENQSNVYRVDLDMSTGRPAGAPQRVTQETLRNSYPMVSPDGRRIAYIARSGSRSGIAVVEANGTKERFIIDDVPQDLLSGIWLLGWASEQEIVLAETLPRAGRQPGFKTLNAATHELKDLQPLPADLQRNETSILSELWYVPTKRDFVYYRFVKGSQTTFQSTGGMRVTSLENDDAGFYEVSPDGRFVIYSYYQDPPGLKPGNSFTGLRLKPFDGGAGRELTRVLRDRAANEEMPTAVSPDGRFLLYSDPMGKLQVMTIATAESSLFLDKNQGDVSFEWTNAHWSPTGSFIVLTGRQTHTERRVFDGLTYDAVIKILKSSGK